jgi:hypothetical protein
MSEQHNTLPESETQESAIDSTENGNSEEYMGRSERRKMEKAHLSEVDKLKHENHRLMVKLQQTSQMLTAALHRAGGTVAIHEGELRSVLSMPLKMIFVRSEPYLIASLEPDDKQEPLIEQARMVPPNISLAKR